MQCNPNAIMDITSTLPVGYTESVHASENIIFNQGFLRESKVLYGNACPTKIVG